MQPDLDLDFCSLDEVEKAINFRPSGEGWYYRNGGQSCLLLTGCYRLRVWEGRDPRPEMKRLVELQSHYL